MDNKLKRFGAVFLSATMLAGCGGRDAYPVSAYQYGDEKKSCKALDMELTLTEEKIERLIPETHKAGKNVALGVAGAFLIVPWFFMDLTKSEKIELEALRQRYNQLLVISVDKDCGFDRQPIADFGDQEAVEQEPANPEDY
jgi:hypothetical protein